MIEKLKAKIFANPKKVILRYFNLPEERIQRIIGKILSMSESEVQKKLDGIFFEFSDRHRNFKKLILENYNRVRKYIVDETSLTQDKQALIGAYFSNEYSIEAAALFNPSIVPHPDQGDAKEGALKFLMSLRATGEGHISSIEFMEGEIDGIGNVKLSERKSFAATGAAGFLEKVDYEIEFPSEVRMSERVLFPFSEDESKGMEDARFVRFEDGNYYATYTAYNGSGIKSKLILTKDFQKFKIHSLSGKGVRDKGMALFPRKINSKYFMTSRQDGENLFIMESDDILNWNDAVKIAAPNKSWEFIQLGNCGSPIETESGWLLITHAVGALRKYVISAILLDLENPSKIIGALREPLIEPDEEEREGYVPNVVYSCGSIVHKNYLVIPYAKSDSSCGFAHVKIEDLLSKMN